MPKTYDCIATTTLGSDVTTVTFTNIPGTYTDLVLTGHLSQTVNDIGIVGYVSSIQSGAIQGTSNSMTVLSAASTGMDGGYEINKSYIRFAGWANGVGTSFNTPGFFISHFPNYTNYNANRSMISESSVKRNDGTMNTVIFANQIRDNSTIGTITFTLASGSSYKTGSTFSLYGIRCA